VLGSGGIVLPPRLQSRGIYSGRGALCAGIGLVSDTPQVPQVRVEPLGVTFEAPPELTLLEAAAFAGVHLPRMCRNGTCRTCLCRVSSGEVRFTIEWPGLSREEKAEGYVLTCVAVALTDLVLEAPDASLT
jgi:ferredoxin